jgi:hypothetical protein
MAGRCARALQRVGVVTELIRENRRASVLVVFEPSARTAKAQTAPAHYHRLPDRSLLATHRALERVGRH